jgi:hypothetical protein
VGQTTHTRDLVASNMEPLGTRTVRIVSV